MNSTCYSCKYYDELWDGKEEFMICMKPLEVRPPKGCPESEEENDNRENSRRTDNQLT